MSADVWLLDDADEELFGDCCGAANDIPMRAPAAFEGHSVNLTYNLTPMLREAGFPGWKALVGSPCVEAGGMLQKVAATLASDPQRFKAFNPENGWGNYELALGAMEHLAKLCANHPLAKFGGWL
jgi:hypothetical protein